MSKEKYEFVIYNPAKSFGDKPNFISINAPLPAGFTSLYAVDAATKEAIEQVSTTQKFAGVVWGPRLWLDLDTREAADVVGNHLTNKGLSFVAYDTGNRGMHFGIARNATPSHLLPAIDKQWASNLAQELGVDIDTSIYTHLHLFRTPGTLHEKTGLPKKLIYEQSGTSISPTLIERKNLRHVRLTENIDSRYSVFDSLRVMANSVPTNPGERHPTLVRLTYALRDVTRVPPEHALWWINEVNKMSSEPKSFEEIEKLFRSIYEEN